MRAAPMTAADSRLLSAVSAIATILNGDAK
jgi:hypothetical protein